MASPALAGFTLDQGDYERQEGVVNSGMYLTFALDE